MTLSNQALRVTAEILRRGRSRPPVPIGHLPIECRPGDLAEAMAIQDAFHDLLADEGHGNVSGTKIGCTTKIMQEFLGMAHPCSGAIFDGTVQHIEGRFEFDSFLHVGVECEVAVRLGSTLRAAGAPHTMESVSRTVSAVFPAIEIVDDRYEDLVGRVPDWRTWVADDFFGAGIVLGEAVRDWHSLDLAGMRGVMRINGAEVGAGYGRDIINGHPLEALVWLANAEAARGRDIPEAWVVMLGSVVQTKWVSRGDVVDVVIDGLGRASARFN